MSASDDPPKKRPMPKGRPFVKGQSGNPGGRAKDPTLLPAVVVRNQNIDTALLEAGPTAVQLLIDIMTGMVEGTTRDRMQAACKILDKLKPDAQHENGGGATSVVLEAFVGAIRSKNVSS